MKQKNNLHFWLFNNLSCLQVHKYGEHSLSQLSHDNLTRPCQLIPCLQKPIHGENWAQYPASGQLSRRHSLSQLSFDNLTPCVIYLSCMQKPKYGTKKYPVGPQFRSKMRPSAVSHLSRRHSVSQPAEKGGGGPKFSPRRGLSTDRRAAPQRRNDFSAEALWATAGRYKRHPV